MRLARPRMLHAAIVGLLAVVSLACRFPYLAQPLQSGHDRVNFHTLHIASLWNTVGLAKAHYSLIRTFPNAGDKGVPYYADDSSDLWDADGNCYFVSFPPGAFLAAFGLLKAIHVSPGNFVVAGLWIRMLPLALFLASAFAFFAMARTAFGERDARFAPLSVFAVALLLFSRSMLYCLGSLYFAFILVIPLWIFTVSVYFNCQAASSRLPAGIPNVLFGCCCFVLCYTDWLGFLACFAFCLDAVLFAGGRENRRLAFIAAGAAFLGGGAILFQYSRVAGLAAFLSASGTRLRAVSPVAGEGMELFSFVLWRHIAWNYVAQHGPVLLLLAVLVGTLVYRSNLRSCLSLTPRQRSCLWCFGVPALSENFLLARHTAGHNYAVAKAAPFLAFLAALLIAKFIENRRGVMPPSRAKLIASLAVLWACVAGVAVYVGTQFRGVDTILRDAARGVQIRLRATPSELVFLCGSPDPATQTLDYFAGRNVRWAENRDEATAFLRRLKRERGIVFIPGEGFRPIRISAAPARAPGNEH